MPAFLAPLAIMAGAKIGKGILGGLGKKKAAKEQYKKEEQNLQSKFESDTDRFNNTEDDRLARMSHVAGQLKGARALSPEVIAAALKRRKNFNRKGVAVDQSKGVMTQMLGDVAGSVGDLASAYMAGSNPNSVSGASKAMGSGGGAVAGGAFNPGIGAGMFQRGACPPGQIC